MPAVLTLDGTYFRAAGSVIGGLQVMVAFTVAKSQDAFPIVGYLIGTAKGIGLLAGNAIGVLVILA
uniref:Uncharacterized protein n=1 Tax=uncultured bacterium IN-01 TaxID=1805579 RepID=A0A142BVF0_9BACT|nr:hypothetical protein [uncultured bacterium IN-01]